MVSTIEELDEMRAKAIFCRHYHRELWEHADCREKWLSDVRAIRDADERAGLVTVPKEPTERMGYSACSCYDGGGVASWLEVWDAMISASTLSKKDNAK